ncbi:flagellar basal-body rod modification protein FlgD [Oribacterium sp. KHPX15]|uniref:flagellar hook assembly protein FlgD n=1 Tax=unclassified Oribacterium TaxID=2629782 RepID=UPI0004E1F449
MADVSGVSGSTSPYNTGSYSVESNDKNTLSITSYFKLLAAQLSSQDMTNPMDNSELLAQMSQMAMVQSLSSMTKSVDSQIAFAQQSYSVGMIGKEVTVLVEGEAGSGQSTTTKTGIVESVHLTDDEPIIRLKGDTTDYKISDIASISNGSSSGSSALEPGSTG